MTSLQIPQGLSLLPFQIEAVEKMLQFLSLTGGVYNACEPGLGKTVQTITVMNMMRPLKTLIVCPAVMRLTWYRELKKWGLTPWVADPRAVLSSKDLEDCWMASCLIVSYDMLSRHIEKFHNFVWDLLVLDEAHYLKSRTAKRTKAILGKLWVESNYKIALSGTPMTQSVCDGFSLFNKFCPTEFPNFYKFANTWAYTKRTPWGDQYFGVKNPEALSALIRSKFFIRYRKEEVLKDLPEKNFIEITLPKATDPELSHAQQTSYTSFLEEVRQSRSRSDAEFPRPPQSVLSARRQHGLLKVSAICEVVSGLLEQEFPVVLFAWHVDVLTSYMNSLRKFNPVLIKGDVSSLDRQKAIENFQEGRTNLFIGQLAAAGTGITLTRSSTCVLAELDWSPAIISQAVDRLHRIGQKKCVDVYYFVVEDSLEEDIVRTLVEKAKTFARVVDG